MSILPGAAFDKKKLIPFLAVSAFFLAYLLLGYFIYKDYGVSWDESDDFMRGQAAYNLVVHGDKAGFDAFCQAKPDSCYHPPFFSMLLYAAAHSGTGQSIFLHRHQVIFATFAFSVFIFFLIGKKIFKDWKIGLLGAFFLIISPRIFAHSFYNPKDIPFLAAYIIGIFTLLLFLEKKNLFTALLHGLAVGLACAIRTPGIILIAVTAFFYLVDLLLAREKLKAYLKGALLVFISSILSALIIYVLSPSLYGNPVSGFIANFKLMTNFHWNNYHFYMGQNITNQLPWHYSLVWFSISSPLFYVVLFLVGLAILAVKTIRSRRLDQLQSMRSLYVAASLGILPILAVIVGKSVLYTDNRQMYFVYPALLLVALFGFVKLLEKLRSLTRRWQLWAALILVLGLASPVYFMLRYHPNENVYFNFLAGSSMSAIKEKFPLDAWGLSDKQALDYILKTDPSPEIRILGFDATPKSRWGLPDDQMDRLYFVLPGSKEANTADYVITIYRYYPEKKFTDGKVYYSVRVGDADICTVYKVGKN